MTTKADATLIYELTFATPYQRDGFRRNFGEQFAPVGVLRAAHPLRVGDERVLACAVSPL